MIILRENALKIKCIYLLLDMNLHIQKIYLKNYLGKDNKDWEEAYIKAINNNVKLKKELIELKQNE
jgi:hypothetical protein